LNDEVYEADSKILVVVVLSDSFGDVCNILLGPPNRLAAS
jgi:hypothetical protein